MGGEHNERFNGIRMCKFLSIERVWETCSLCGGFKLEKIWTKKTKINKEKFLAYFKKKSQSKDETDGIQITNVLTSVTENVTFTEIASAEEEMQKANERPKKYQVEISAKIKKEVGLYARDCDTVSAIKNSLLNIRNILFSEPQLTPGKRSAIMVTGSLPRELEDPTCKTLIC